MRRRRAGPSSTNEDISADTTSAPSPNEPSTSSSGAGAQFADITLAPTIQGVLGRYIGKLLAVIIGYWLVVYEQYDDMAIKLGGWIMGRQADKSEESVPLVDKQKEGEKKVKRRRRKEPTDVAGMFGLPLDTGQLTIVDGYYPGMVNLSGVLCYMNSVLQVGWPAKVVYGTADE